MLNYISLYPNTYADDFNKEFLLSTADPPIEDFIVTSMYEFESIENIKIEDVKIVRAEDEVDINEHMININYKRKDIANIEYPKFKYMADSRYGEVAFKIRITTNLNEEVIVKKILFPIEVDGSYLINGKKMTAIWQLIDASTYNQRGKTTLKSKMPIIIYKNKHRIVADVDGNDFIMPSYSYALNSKSKRPGSKVKTKFINPLLLYCTKLGMLDTIDFFGMKDIVSIVSDYKESDKENYYIFPMDELFIKVDSYLYDKYEMVRAFTCMCFNLRSRDFPINKSILNNKEYWICRIGYIGSAKNKNILSFREKGMTTLYMIERLLDRVTTNNLRLPDIYKHNIYYVIYWLITNYDEIKKKSNIDMNNKRIRKNEYIVLSSLGKKINENINKLIEKKSKSKMNTMDTLLELFNFNSDIIISGMRNLNDLIKTDDLVNDMTFLANISYSAKGFQSNSAENSKMLATKYRYLDPSMVGKTDINVSSNSDVGTSGMFTPFVKTYNGYYFTPDPEPCTARYEFDKALVEDENLDVGLNISTFDSYIQDVEARTKFRDALEYEPILIVEKE